jgi:hypothetical protein
VVNGNGDGDGRTVRPGSPGAEPAEGRAGEAAEGGLGEAAGTGERGSDSGSGSESRGERILRFDIYATVAFAVVSLLEAAVPEPTVVLSLPLDLVLFVVGCGAFMWAYAVAVGRSRYEELTMGGVFYPGTDVAPARAVRVLRLCLLAQVVVAVAAAALRPFSPAAFAVLVPMLGLGLMALYGARHGRFPAKDELSDRPDEG